MGNPELLNRKAAYVGACGPALLAISQKSLKSSEGFVIEIRSPSATMFATDGGIDDLTAWLRSTLTTSQTVPDGSFRKRISYCSPVVARGSKTLAVAVPSVRPAFVTATESLTFPDGTSPKGR